MHTITLAIDGMSCGHCVASVRTALTGVPGLELQDVRVGSAVVRTLSDPGTAADAALAAVQDAGYDATADVSPVPAGAAGGAASCACCSGGGAATSTATSTATSAATSAATAAPIPARRA